MATINTRILLRYDTYENWSKTDVALKGGNFVLKKGEVGFCEVPSDNTAATTAPTVLFKVGDGTNAFKDLKWASALAADVYSWAKENKITIVKNGTGNVVSNIEWDATANNGKGGIKFSTIDVYTKTESDNLYAKKQNANGGFEAGSGATATTGGAIGEEAVASAGGAIGNHASATTGGAIGNRAKTDNGGAIGDGASSLSGGAIGSGAKTSYGFAGGKDAKTIDSDGFGIDAIQLGTGTNNTVRSLQVYNYTLMNPDGSIPAERLTNAATPEELERLQYYGNKDIVPSDENYFTVNATGETITGLTDTGKTQTELVIPYKINGVEITTLYSEVASGPPQSILNGSTTITKITIPKSITTLGRGVFYDCSSLTSINIPNGVISIGDYAFNFCTGLTSINIPDSVISIGENAFNNCTGLTSIEIPNSVTSIEQEAFYYCTSLTSLKIPNSITSIENYTFEGCTALTSVKLPNSITSIADKAFYNCTSLTSINIPNSVISIGNSAFHIFDKSGPVPKPGLTIYCEQNSYAETYAQENGFNIVYTDVSNITTTEELERLQYYGDANIVPNESYFTVNGSTITGLTETGKTQTGTLVIPYKINGTIITSLASDNSESILAGALDKVTKVILPNTITTIGNNAFFNCTSLTSINIPNSVTSIGTSAFNGCTMLTSINIPNSVTSIGTAAFYGCTGLTSINIPNSVTSIEGDTFGACSSLTSINIPSSVTSIRDYVFKNISSSQLTIYCEQGSYAETYAEAFNISVVYTDISKETINNLSSKEELERLNYYGNKNIIPADESYFTVNETGETITGITMDGENNLFGEVVIPYKINGTIITSIIGRSTGGAYSVLYGSFGITKITLPNTITSIGNNSFVNCSSLTSINISNSVTSIGVNAFKGCTSLTSINIPNSVTSIGSGAFNGCTGLTSIDIPNSIISIDATSFTNIPVSQLTIYCEQGSYADTYAQDKGFNIVYTDINKDSLVGQKIENGGEIFNDYTNNVAQAPYSHAEGYKTSVQCYMGYKITDWGNSTSKTYTLTSVDGLAVDDVASISWLETDGSGVGFEKDFGTITTIDSANNTITVDTYIAQLEGFSALIFVNNKPTIGDTQTSYSSHVEGYKTIANGEGAHAEGTETTASNYGAHAEGYGTIASGENSHAEGGGTTASGFGAHAEGGRNTASGKYAHAEGWNNIASGKHSHAEGRDNTATKDYQHVQGKYSIEDITTNGYAHIVGNGTSNTKRSNAHTLDWNGNAWFAGNVSIGGTYNTTTGKYDNAKELAVKDEVIAETERLQYYGDSSIIPSDDSYFTVNGSTITGLTDTGKTQTGTLVIPYKINGIKITELKGNIISFTSVLNGATDKITKVILPNSINNIGVASFYGCTALTEINIPDSVTNIQNYAFNGCTSLESINISNNVTNIGLVAFNGCTSLETIRIPNSVTSIGDNSFDNITLSQLTIYCEQNSYADFYAKQNGFGNIVYTDINSTYFNNYVSKDGSNTITGTIDASSGSILVSEPTSDTQAANKKYVDDSITAGIQANDAMTFKGLLGGEGNITELPTDIATVRNGDTYKVAVDGTYNEIAAKSGDMFIALVKNSTVSWQFIPSADDGNVLANNDLTADALIVGNGSKEIKTLANGSNDQILRIVNNIPTWEKEYEVVATDTSITVTKDTENKQYKISVNSVDVNKLTQSEGTVLVLNGGNSAN